MTLFRTIWDRLNSHESLDLAAQVSFYFVLSLFPFLIVLASLLGWLPTTTRWDSFSDWLTTYFPQQAKNTVLATMLELSRGYTRFLSFGLLATIWSASSGFMSLMDALSIAYGVKDGRNYVKRRAIAIGATLVAAVFVLTSFVLWNVGHLAAVFIVSDLKHLVLFQMQWRFIRWVAILGLMCIGIDLVNYFLPAARRRWKWITPGTMFVVLAFVGGTFLLNVYLRFGTNIPKVYGTLAGFIVLLLWVYLANLILLIGAETDTALQELHLPGPMRPVRPEGAAA